jgi:hypothetical protein
MNWIYQKGELCFGYKYDIMLSAGYAGSSLHFNEKSQ